MLTRSMATGVALLLAVHAGPAVAGTITSGTVYNNPAGSLNIFNLPGNMTNQSGLSANYIDGVTDFDTFIAGAPTHLRGIEVNTWRSPDMPTLPTVLDFDLGSEMLVESLAIWNGAANGNASIQRFQVSGSNLPGFGISTLVGVFENPGYVFSDPYPVTEFDLSDVSARYMRIEILSYRSIENRSIGIGEVAWETSEHVPPIPLPAALPMLGAGLTALFALQRRRRRNP